MWIRRILQVLTVLAAAFALTSAVMFWLPIIEHSTGRWVADSGRWVTDLVTPYYDYGYDYTVLDQALKDLSPIEERQRLGDIVSELKARWNAELLQMKAFDDVCTNNLVDCLGLASTKIKPFIDAILSDRQTAETMFYYRGSLFVSLLALIFAGLTYLRRGANTKE
jgi:hypothetical protein